jgi:N-acetyl-1-D-myo-inositol-2-amino-2-deoxy-alpha-D-glucopyranoside deacetylase
MVHAHPDDETTTTGATVRHYAEEGVPVHLVTCTRGEYGEILAQDVFAAVSHPDPEIAAESLARHRVRELAEACDELGFASRRFLAEPGRWWDSGMPAGPHVTAFSAGDPVAQADELAKVIREVRPQVVVTYDERGGYRHPDHIRAHEVTLAAVRRAADPGAAKELGTPWATAKVYACVVPHSSWRHAAAVLADAEVEGPNPFAGGVEALRDPAAEVPFGVPDELVTARIDARRWLSAKVAAMRAHRSQMHRNGWFFALAEDGGGFGIEHYRLLLGTPGRAGDGEFEDDLFAGIRQI